MPARAHGTGWGVVLVSGSMADSSLGPRLDPSRAAWGCPDLDWVLCPYRSCCRYGGPHPASLYWPQHPPPAVAIPAHSTGLCPGHRDPPGLRLAPWVGAGGLANGSCCRGQRPVPLPSSRDAPKPHVVCGLSGCSPTADQPCSLPTPPSPAPYGALPYRPAPPGGVCFQGTQAGIALCPWAGSTSPASPRPRPSGSSLSHRVFLTPRAACYSVGHPDRASSRPPIAFGSLGVHGGKLGLRYPGPFAASLGAQVLTQVHLSPGSCPADY